MTKGKRKSEPEPDVLAALDLSGFRTIVAELADEAAHANMLWTRAVAANRHLDRDSAMTHLAELHVYLKIVLPNQGRDLLRATDEALGYLEAVSKRDGSD
jgi:hypothetical protein